MDTSGSWKMCTHHIATGHLHLFFTPTHYAHGTLIRWGLWPSIHQIRTPAPPPAVGVKLEILYCS